MPCYIRMKRTFLQGLLWLYLLGFGFMALSLEPGVSLFLDFDNLPDTNFSCVGKVIGGYYADLETNCQMFHVCTIGQLDEPMDIRFLCLNGTVFDQETRVCERIDEVDCSKSEQFYSLNLELYGNTQPAILEESPETEQPLIIKSTTTSTTTTQAPKSSRAPFYTTATTPRATTSSPQVISTHHFPVVNSPDIRFNPEEINISLHPGAPPDIRTKPVTFHQHGYSDNNKNVVVTTHSDNSDNQKVTVTTHAQPPPPPPPPPEQGFIERPQVQVKNSHQNFNRPTPSDINFGFNYHQTDSNDEYRVTEDPQVYHFHSNYRPSQDYSVHRHRNHPHTHQFQDDLYTTTTLKVNNYQQNAPTTSRNYFLQSLTPPAPNQHHHYNQQGTDKPQRLQLPLPLLPTLPPLTFSSPAPFALQRHIETKRYTKDHQAPPRIIISASASVSDASGRRLNYSLGTIGAAEILEEPPSSYDEYKETDVGLDPFYHDVPKIKRTRGKREVGLQLRPKDVIKNEKEAETVLKFLVDWYEDNRRTIADPIVDQMIDDSRPKRQIDSKIKHSDIIRNEQEAVDVLKFLLEWYKDNEKTSTVPTVPTSTEAIREEITPITKRDTTKYDYNEPKDYSDFRNSDLFNKNSKFSIIGRTPESNNEQKALETNISTETVVRGDEDYVNDNFEPITYYQKYGTTKTKNNSEPLEEKYKNKIPSDYVDDNIEPIYYRNKNPQAPDSNKIIGQIYHDIKELNNALLDTKTEESKAHQVNLDDDIRTNNINRIAGQINHDIKELNDALLTTPNASKEITRKELDLTPDSNNIIKSPINHESKELNDALLAATFEDSKEAPPSGDTKTNNINDDNQTNQIKDTFLTPQYDTTTTTEKTIIVPTVVRTRGNRRRGRVRTVTTTPKTKEKPKVVIEKITEKAHTAKDDFNYLRTLYKVLSTTPMYNLLEEANPYIKLKKKTNLDKDIFSQNNDINETEDKIHSESKNVPILTTEQTTSTPSRRANRRRGRVKEQSATTRRVINRNRKKTTTAEPTKETIPETSSLSYETITPSDETKTTQSLPTVDPRLINGLEEEQSDLGDETSTPYSFVFTTETPESTTTTPIVTTGINPLETQTAFFNELTQNYKRLFGVVTSTIAGETQPTTLDVIKILGPHLVTTEPFKAWRRGYGTTESPTEEDTFFTPFFDNGQFRKRSGNSDPIQYSTLPVTTSERSHTTKEDRFSTITQDSDGEQTSATIPTTLSDLYKEVNIETVNGKVLLQSIKDESTSTQESGTVSSNLEDKGITSTTEYNIRETEIPPISTTETYETSTMEDASTTQLASKRFFKDVEEEEDEDVEISTPPGQVLEENRHFLSSFTQSFSFTEEMDKDIPTIHESEILTKEVRVGEPFPTTVIEETTTTQSTTEAVTVPSTTTEYITVTTEKKNDATAPTTQFTTEKMKEFIKEVEASTKSVMVNTELPLTGKTDSSEMGGMLKSLVEEIQDMTKSKIGATTLEFMTQKVEVTTLPSTTLSDSGATQKGEPSTYAHVTRTEGLTTSEVAVTTEEAATTTQLPSPSTTDVATTTTTTERPIGRGRGVIRRGGRRTTRPSVRRTVGRHRFSTETSTRRAEGRKQTIEEEIVDEIARTSHQTSTEPLRPARRRLKKRKRINSVEESTDAPLHRSVSATHAGRSRQALPTTPLSKTVDSKHYIFNCFGKAMNKFYPDPRDCRLFHYCTHGYSKNQLLDMKFVCDQNTYFDDERLICTKVKPRRCL